MFEKERIPIGAILKEGLLPSRVQLRIYRRRGYTIAGDVDLAPGVVIRGDDVRIGPGATFGIGTVVRGRRIEIGPRTEIGSLCFFDGREIVIGADTVFREQVLVGGPLFPDSLLEVGRRVRVFQTCFLNPSKPLRIGDETGVGGRSSIFTHGSWQSAIDGYPVAFEHVTIGRNVWLPWHVFILPGVEIGDNATVGAGSVVNRSIPAGTLAAGVPAKVIRGPDEWPRPIAPPAQWLLARSILEQFADFVQDNGVVVTQDESEGRATVRIHHGGAVSQLALIDSPARLTRDDVIVIELESDPTHTYPPGATWFSLRERRKGGPRTDVGDEVEHFIERFGIRFAPFDES